MVRTYIIVVYKYIIKRDYDIGKHNIIYLFLINRAQI